MRRNRLHHVGFSGCIGHGLGTDWARVSHRNLCSFQEDLSQAQAWLNLTAGVQAGLRWHRGRAGAGVLSPPSAPQIGPAAHCATAMAAAVDRQAQPVNPSACSCP